MANDTLDVSRITGLSCEECSKDIPYTAEAEDYVAHFCGLSCYTEWKEKHKGSDSEAKKQGRAFVYKGKYTDILNPH